LLAARDRPFAQETHAHVLQNPSSLNSRTPKANPSATQLFEAAHGVKIKNSTSKGLPAGEHSIHILIRVAKCPKLPTSIAGPHFSPAGHMDHDHNSAPAGIFPSFTLIIAADGSAHCQRCRGQNVTLGDDPVSVFQSRSTVRPADSQSVVHAVASPGGGQLTRRRASLVPS